MKDKKIIKLFYFFTLIVLYSPIAYGYEYLSPPQIQSKILAIENQIERISKTKNNLIDKASIKENKINNEIKLLDNTLLKIDVNIIDLHDQQNNMNQSITILENKITKLESSRENKLSTELRKKIDNDVSIKKFRSDLNKKNALLDKSFREYIYWRYYQNMYEHLVKKSGVRQRTLEDMHILSDDGGDDTSVDMSDALIYIFDDIVDAHPAIARDLMNIALNELTNLGTYLADSTLFNAAFDDSGDFNAYNYEEKKLIKWNEECRSLLLKKVNDQSIKNNVLFSQYNIVKFKKSCSNDIRSINFTKYQLSNIYREIRNLTEKTNLKYAKYYEDRKPVDKLKNEITSKKTSITFSLHDQFNVLYPEFEKKKNSYKKDIDIKLSNINNIKEELEIMENDRKKIFEDIDNLKYKVTQDRMALDIETSKLDQEHIGLANKKYMWEQKLEIAIDNNNNHEGLIESFNK